MGECPLGKKCLTPAIVYRATVTDEDSNTETYTGLTSNTFKKRFYKHRSDMNNHASESSTTLSTHIWKLKNASKNYNIQWEIVRKAKPFNPVSKRCSLCITEKLFIIFHPEGASLNKRSELFSPCRHRLSNLLQNT